MAVLELIKLYFLVQVASTSGPTSEHCHSVLDSCAQKGNAWARCYEEGMRSCTRRGRRAMNSHVLDFFQNDFNASSDVEHTNNVGHSVYIPSEALVGSARSHVSRNTRVTVTVFNSSLFHAEYWPNKTILGGTVLGVTVGNGVRNLNRPVRMSFGRINETGGQCVFYKEQKGINDTVLALPHSLQSAGLWSVEGCNISQTNTKFICSCDHLSFFAVLVNTDVPIDKVNARALSYISYVGCGLSVFFSAIAILMQLCVRNGRSENSMIIHLNLTGALFFLHLFFLLSAWWAGRGLGEDKGGVPCQALGLLLHYSLLATFTWTAIEAFHLYMLLVRIFNIYVKRYLVKLGLVGWGVPMVMAITCAGTEMYGGHILVPQNGSGSSTLSFTALCWITDRTVQHITVSGYLGLVFLFSTVMLGVMMVKLRKVRGNSVRHQERRRLWRDCVTILGMACVLGVPWGLAFTTYSPLPLPSLYLFTILNGFQGLFMFLWFLALKWKPCRDENTAVKDPSTQKMETSFRN